MNHLPLNPLKILIVDDHPLIRSGFKDALLKKSYNFRISEANSGETAIQVSQSQKPDVVIMDISMPGINGIEAATKIKAINRETKVVIFSNYCDHTYVCSALNAGIEGYVLKSDEIEILVEAISTVSKGLQFISPEAKVIWSEYLMKKSFKTNKSKSIILSEREKEILVRICKGKSNFEIGEELFISEHTVKNHKASIMTKTNCHNKIALLNWAIQEKIHIPI